MYRKYRYKPKNDALPFLDLSEIPGVRKHCISLPSEKQYQMATDYLQNSIPALLGDIQLWIQSGARSATSEMRQSVCRVADKIENQITRVGLDL